MSLSFTVVIGLPLGKVKDMSVKECLECAETGDVCYECFLVQTDNGTKAVVNYLPTCDLCESVASYDTQTTLGGRWGYLCKAHYLTHASDTVKRLGLGLGRGQRLVLA